MIRRWIQHKFFGEDDVSRKLIVGLGNPGRKYEGTRHNIGFAVLDRLGQRHRLDVSRQKFNGLYATGPLTGEDVVLLMPQTFMNKSGKSVVAARQFYDISSEDTIVLHDDIDLDAGQLKIKSGGGHGGHNGLRDIVAKTGEKDFIRIRLGVGRPVHGDVTGHVLGRFDSDEMPTIEDLIERACDAVETVITDGVQAAQNGFH